MAKKVAEKINSQTIIKCKDFEVVEGNIDSPVWVVEVDNRLKVALDIDEYLEMMEMTKKLLEENIELKLEKAILSEFPIDYEDVKAVVLEEMKKNEDKSIEDIVNKVKLEHPNLFYNLNIELDKIF